MAGNSHVENKTLDSTQVATPVSVANLRNQCKSKQISWVRDLSIKFRLIEHKEAFLSLEVYALFKTRLCGGVGFTKA